MPSTDRVPTTSVLFDYRGHRYEEHSVDRDSPYERRLALEPGWSREEFPDGSVFGDDPDDPWVSLGAGAIDTAWIRTVSGRWRDCEVLVGKLVKAGADRGRLVVHYSGTRPAEADAAGFMPQPYQHWYAIVDPAEVHVADISVERREWV